MNEKEVHNIFRSSRIDLSGEDRELLVQKTVGLVEIFEDFVQSRAVGAKESAKDQSLHLNSEGIPFQGSALGLIRKWEDLRKDEVKPGLSFEDLKKMSPFFKDGYFTVPAITGQGEGEDAS